MIIACWIVGGLAAQAIALAGQDPGLADRPNLLVIVADDHAAWTLGIDGDPRRATPNLDALARQGTLFSRAYCNSPVCTPSRQSLITGKLPHAIGVTQLPTILSDDVLTLGEWLRDLDYATAAIGKMHFNGASRSTDLTCGSIQRIGKKACGSDGRAVVTFAGRGVRWSIRLECG